MASKPPSHLPPSALPAVAATPSAPAGIGFELAADPAALTPGTRGRFLEVGSGVPDPRLLPAAALARAYRHALTTRRGGALPVHDPQGHPSLREALSRMLAGTRGIAADPVDVIVTRGSQMALVLLAQTLLAPGDRVAVEALGGRGAWEAFARTGARCHPVPVDRDGLVTAELERLLEAGRLRAVLVTPQRQYPTLAVLSPERRARLLELAAAHRFAVLEVDQDSEFQFDGRPPAPLAARDRAGVVVHVGTLSKVFSPDLRLGYVHGPGLLVRRMTGSRATFDRHGDPVLERAMAELMEDGELERHLNRMPGVGPRAAACHVHVQGTVGPHHRRRPRVVHRQRLGREGARRDEDGDVPGGPPEGRRLDAAPAPPRGDDLPARAGAGEDREGRRGIRRQLRRARIQPARPRPAPRVDVVRRERHVLLRPDQGGVAAPVDGRREAARARDARAGIRRASPALEQDG